jgi:hypothetical protein
MRSLFLAWQAPNRAWFPIGLLDTDVSRHYYAFRYTNGALDAKREVGFTPLPAFPDFEQRYESGELFPLFGNRVLNSHRKGFRDYLQSLDLEPDTSGPIDILSVSGGERQTDSFEVFPKIEKGVDGSFACRFFLHGWRHMREDSRERAMALKPGEALGISLELTNPVTTVAIQLTTRDDYHFVGWTPRYLVEDLLLAIADGPHVGAKVVRINGDDVPPNRRVLVELSGKLPQGVEPMTAAHFQPIVPSDTRATH